MTTLENKDENNVVIEDNMVRDRAKKLPEITDDKWELVSKHNRWVVDDYFEVNEQLSRQTLKQYKSGMRQFFWWVKEHRDDKPMYKINKRDFLRYRSYLMRHGLSSGSLGFKKSAVSSLCNHIENIIAEDEEDYKDFRNFTRGLPPLPKNHVYEKVAITFDEYQLLLKELKEQEDYLGLAWVATAFNIGGRRNEILQLKTEILDYPYEKDSDGDDLNYIIVKKIRGKGAGEDGKQLEYMVNDEALDYMKLWVSKRGYDHEYIFTVKHKGVYKQISESWANYFCTSKLSKILGRRINPHLFKASCITHKLSEGKNMKAVSKYIAHHESVSTTQAHYDLRSDEEERNSLF